MKRLLLTLGLFLAPFAASAQCVGTGGINTVDTCPAAVNLQLDDEFLGYQLGQNPHTRKITTGQILGLLAAGSGVTLTTVGNSLEISATGSGGTVTITGSPVSGNLTKFSGASTITNGDLTGDLTTSGTLATTLATVNAGPGSVGSSTAIPVLTTNGKGLVTAQTTAAVVAPAGTLTGATLASNVLASSLTSVGTLAGLTVTGSFTATGLVTNADLANPSTTVNGQTCTLGSSCTITASAGTITVGSTTVASGTTTRVLFDNAGTLGEYTISGSGNVAMTTSPSFTTPALGTPSAAVLTNATGLPLGGLLAQAANTVVANVTAGSASPTAASLPSCVDTGGNHLNYTNGTGFSCGTSGSGGSGTVTSVTLATPNSTLALSGTNPVTTSGTINADINLSHANTWAAAQTFTNSDLLLLGSSTGATTFTSANAGASDFTLTVPARTATLGTTTGTLTSGDCAKFDASGNIIAAGAACGTGSGNVTSVGGSSTGSTLTASGGPVTGSGTLNFELNLSHANTWAAAQSFNSGDLKLNGASSGTTTLNAAAAAGTTTITLPAGTTDFSATGGANQVVKQTSSGGAFTVAALGSGDVPCAAMPALTGAVTSSAGSCATTSATVTNSKCITFDSTTAVTAQTISFPIEWTSYTITQVQSAVNGGGSFTANVKIGSTSATGCSAISVSGATNTNTTCTAANTGSANDIINVVLSSPSGTVNQAYVCPVFTHTVN